MQAGPAEGVEQASIRLHASVNDEAECVLVHDHIAVDRRSGKGGQGEVTYTMFVLLPFY